MSRFTSSMARCWSGVSWNSNASSNSRCQFESGGNAWPGAVLRSAVKRQQLLRHVADRFAHARLARFPDRRAQPIERRFYPAERLIFLHQVNARERNVELGVSGISQEHEFAGRAFDDDLPQAFELPDAVIHVNHVIARLEVREIAEETRRLWPRARALRRKRFKQIGVAIDRQLRFGKHDAFG